MGEERKAGGEEEMSANMKPFGKGNYEEDKDARMLRRAKSRKQRRKGAKKSQKANRGKK